MALNTNLWGTIEDNGASNLYFRSNTGRKYEILEGRTIAFSDEYSKKSDIAFVLFDNTSEYVSDVLAGYFYGASAINKNKSPYEFRSALSFISDMVYRYEVEHFGIPNFEREEIDLCGPTDALLSWFLNKANTDQYRNRDKSDIPFRAWHMCETLGRLEELCESDNCHFYLYVEADDDGITWNIVNTFKEICDAKDSGIEFYEVFIDCDPYLWKITF